MTKADMKDIENLVASATEINKMANNANAPYVNDSIVKYATDAVADYKSVKKYILNILNKNKHLFGSLSKVYKPFGEVPQINGKWMLKIGEAIQVYVILKDFDYVGYDYINIKDFYCEDIKFYHSDTKQASYNICSSWDLVDFPHDDVAKEAYDTPKTAFEWNKLFGLARWTEEKNKILVKTFREELNKIIEANRKRFNKTEEEKQIMGMIITLSWRFFAWNPLVLEHLTYRELKIPS